MLVEILIPYVLFLNFFLFILTAAAAGRKDEESDGWA